MFTTNSHTVLLINWSNCPNFSEAEFVCKHTGQFYMDKEFMDRLQALRSELGQPMTITNGYHHPTHPVEAPFTLVKAVRQVRP